LDDYKQPSPRVAGATAAVPAPGSRIRPRLADSERSPPHAAHQASQGALDQSQPQSQPREL